MVPFSIIFVGEFCVTIYRHPQRLLIATIKAKIRFIVKFRFLCQIKYYSYLTK